MPSVQLEDVMRAHGDALHAYVTRLTNGDRFAAEDVVQETWVRAWRNLDRLTENLGSVRGWLLRVAHNIAIDQHRSRRARPTEVGLPEQDLEYAAVAPSANDQVETKIVVRAMLETLSPAHRDTVLEVYYADRTAASAAKVLGVPAGTVKSRLHNALRTLRESVSAQPLAA
ncbi:RNA polymerase sigma-70 factor, ECF subfamily [Saccharopolyspora antimicrobica]|uniref:RNA polymerase sigma-70 factor (ECF subfamily) n=2 Tax=Saccharopolyspora TaxID=1835 RepID=A0A1I5I3Y7_9PSEU|nr:MULTISPECIES: sigma-70 family RNA polymerase sigma factor [Saccharopolyspora]RKT83051.1 RNA polymerase sigma-70 factor (ECF subfamily) [Saccharopolyspora antimicrobica]SEG75362.1 RNA polymerase sigma-70 factor, ECF subfamily [Saccharopolyspora kobensis]SFC96228.1 RNA polymerase sigma-70 factor, ECF subfamily [Saccharopolyspora kobensis]SFO55282.1 RNA polymerase sigma-70 factor, ECF subfamily [Saccharopolyspora antimicrobica]